jgi:hypothetical protein
MKRIKVVDKLQIYKFGSVHFWYMIDDSSKEATELAKKSKVSMRAEIRGFHGTFIDLSVHLMIIDLDWLRKQFFVTEGYLMHCMV